MGRDRDQTPRLLFLGTRGLFSRVVLEGLLGQGHDVVGIVVPSESGDGWRGLAPPPPVLSELRVMRSFVDQTIVEMGWQRSIPVWEAKMSAKRAIRAIRGLHLSAIVVACWPKRIPNRLPQLPEWGALNVHPSLLPDFRGPVPLFWQRRAGLREGGVTIHRMSERLDEGDMLAQTAFALPDGATGEELDALAAQQGGQLLGMVIDDLHNQTNQTLTPHPQPAGGSYQSWPTDQAFTIPTTWSARHAYNFMQAANQWHTPFTIRLPNRPLHVQRALAFAANATLNAPVMYADDHIAIQFTPGVLYVTR